jgi:MFS family permease
VGSLVCVLCGLLYPILTSVAGFLFLRLIHGFSTGFKPTATAAYIADLIPKSRWGEALGLHSLAFSIGMAIGPAAGSALTLWTSIDVLFYTSSVIALISVVILFNMKETLKEVKPWSISLLRIKKEEIFEKAVLPAAVVTVLYYTTYGVILTLIPDWTSHIGIENKGLFFVAFTISSIAVRFIAGKASDRHGRIIVIKWGLIVMIISMIVLGLGNSLTWFLIGGGLYGFATGIVSPALSAWTIDLSSPQHRGKAMATMYIALEVGIGVGALSSGWIYLDFIERIPFILQGTSISVILALFYIMWWERRHRNAS